jgi:opacity protein-like surface antigen
MLRRFGFFLVAAVVVAAPAAAQDERPVKLTIGGGYTGVLGPISDRVGNGGNFTIGALFKVAPMISLQGEYGWNGMQKKNVQLPVSATPNGSTQITDFNVDGNMQYGDFNVVLRPDMTDKKASPYFLAGMGVYYRPVTVSTPGVGYATVCDPYWYVCYPTAVSVDNIIGQRSSTDFGMNFGGGMNVKLGENTSLFFEVRYHYIWGPKVDGTVVTPYTGTTPTNANGQFLPITVGFRF